MKTKIITSVLFSLLFASSILAQDRTTVNAMSSEISDNLDLRAVASIFGESKNLENFERRLNDPAIQISNLDLNDDHQVDYLRVIESVEGYTHLIVVQAVLGHNTFQDVATIEVERDRNNQVNVQVVGDVYMYGPNYIYEPVYVYSPAMYSSFWSSNYRPYCSTWYWNYYPTYYQVWNPYPIYSYQNNIISYINYNNYYNYVTVRRSHRAVALHNNYRANYCEKQYPTRAFSYRNATVSNRYELERSRNIRNAATQNQIAYTSPVKHASGIRQVSGNARTYTASPIDNPTINGSPVRSNSSPIRSAGVASAPIKSDNPRPMNIARTGTPQSGYSNPVIASGNVTNYLATEIRRPRAEITARVDSGITRQFSGNVSSSSSLGRTQIPAPRAASMGSAVQRQNTPIQNRSYAN